MVRVEKGGAEAGELQARGAQATTVGDVLEETARLAPVKRIGLGVEVVDEDIEEAVAVDVFGLHPHAGLDVAMRIEGDPPQHAVVDEVPSGVS